jgi:molecular chaperone GrpE
VDNLERALASMPAETRLEGDFAALLAGVEATRRALLDTFVKYGLKRLNPMGEPFDPHLHEASFEVVDEQHPPGTVTTVVQPGYLHHGRLLRPALVGVSKMPGATDKDAALDRAATSSPAKPG